MTPILVDVRQAAELLGVGIRTVHKLRHDTGFPQPIKLSERATRWRVADLQAWIAAQPAVADRIEPASLIAARASRRGSTGGSAGGLAGGSQTPPAAKPRPLTALAERASVEPAKSNPPAATTAARNHKATRTDGRAP